MHEHKVNVIVLVISWVKNMIKGPLDLDAAPRTADRLSHRTRTCKQTSTNNKKQYTKQNKQYKKRLLNYSTHCNDRVSARSSKTDLKRKSYG